MRTDELLDWSDNELVVINTAPNPNAPDEWWSVIDIGPCAFDVSTPPMFSKSEHEELVKKITRAVNSFKKAREALELAESTINRLDLRNSAKGTLDVIHSALALMEGGAQ